jgi:pimeloyl-ACP methyl ester carboxylesterase
MTDWDACLAAFRASHPPARARLLDVDWEYLDAGAGPPILLLPGGLGVAESAFRTISRLESRARLIAPTIPAVADVGQVVDGLAALLDQAGVERARVSGHSLGSGLAHVLVRHHPDRVDRLALGSFGLYTPTHARLVTLFFRLPPRFLVAYYRRAAARLTHGAEPGEAAFLRASVDDVLRDPRQGLARLRLLVDLVNHPRRYRLREPVELPGRILIIGAADDRGFSAVEREALIATYPGALVWIFPRGGHWVALAQQAAYETALDGFLLGA